MSAEELIGLEIKNIVEETSVATATKRPFTELLLSINKKLIAQAFFRPVFTFYTPRKRSENLTI